MKLYSGKKILVSVRIPISWRKALVIKAKKEITAFSDVIGNCLEKKYGLGKGKVYKPKRDENALNVGIDK